MAFRQIPADSFSMGSRGYESEEEPAHLVTLSHPYYLGIYPVTQHQFSLWTNSESYTKWRQSRGQEDEHKNYFENLPDHPAEKVTWYEAQGYCEWLKKSYCGQFPVGYYASLPTEAQWEYACRAGTETEYYSGDGESALTEAGWFAGNSREKTHPVGEKRANTWGLHDMHGNVWEWCREVYDAHAYRKRLDGIMDPETAEDVECVEEEWVGTFKNRVEVLKRIRKKEEVHTGDRKTVDGVLGFFAGLPDVQQKPWNLHTKALKNWLNTPLLTTEENELIQALEDAFARQLPGTGEDSRFRANRGGSWGGSAWNCRSVIRDSNRPGIRDWNQGFRVCLVPGPVDFFSWNQGTEVAPTRGDGTPRDEGVES